MRWRDSAALSVLPTALAATALVVPLLVHFGCILGATAILAFFAPVCHQDAARSFWFLGAPVAVCARCLGIYLGAAAGVWLRARRRGVLMFLAVAAALNGLDVVTEVAGLHGNWMDVRFGLGLVLGVGVGMVVVARIQPSLRDSDFLRALTRY